MSKKVTIHCSDSPFGNSELIGSWHRAKGWDKIGYHFVITNGRISSKYPYDSFYDGLIETGRHYNKMGSHVKGYNKDNIGICLIGESGNFTKAQLNKLDQLLAMLKAKFGELYIQQHSFYDPTNKPFCAGLDDGYIKRLQESFD